MFFRSALVAFVLLLPTQWNHADERLKGIACRSVHLGYPAEVGTEFYNEITVKESAEGTYFMVCGWTKGYFGIQELGDGKKLVIFSVWDPTAGDDPASVPDEKRVKMLHKDESVRVKRFGNEGTGGQSFFDYQWQLGQTYRFLVKAAQDGDDRTAYSGYFFVPEENAWKHLVTFSTLTPKGDLLRGYYSFVEDFRRNRISTTYQRKAFFGAGWIKDTEGNWSSVDSARFTADANPVTNIDAGSIGDLFFLVTGGKTENTTTKLREIVRLPESKRESKRRAPDDLPK